MITAVSVCVCAMLALPGTWLAYRQGFLRGFAASLCVALISIPGFVFVALAMNKIRYGYWTTDVTREAGDSTQFVVIFALAVALLILVPLQLIGIGVAWAIRRRKRRLRG